MNVLIVEDEPLAAENLKIFLAQSGFDIQVLEVLDSVVESVEWFMNNPHPPLVFMDIHLGDGICFEIFKQIKVTSFIVFTTAYDQYALQAFKVNSVDYLLKPIQQEAINEALHKYQGYADSRNEKLDSVTMSKLLDAIQHKQVDYKERFVVKVGTHIRMVKNEDIACFYSLEKASYLVTKAGKTYLVDFALDKLFGMLNPTQFYRISRKYIIELSAIIDVISLGPLRIKVKILGCNQDDLFVSRDRIKGFKKWLEG